MVNPSQPVPSGGVGPDPLAPEVAERQRLELEASFLESVLDDCGEAIISYTLEGTILRWSAGAASLFGHAAAAAIG